MSSRILTAAIGGIKAAGAAPAARALATVSAGSSFTLPDMPYDYGALEPFIAGEIMKIHHTKHHQAYVTNLNAALEKYQKAQAANNIAEMIALQGAIRFNGGGHINHSIFWQNLAPAGKGGGGEPTGELGKAIADRFGSFGDFKKQMQAAAVGVQGSGWAWLGYNKATGKVDIATCANQDPLAITGLTPLVRVARSGDVAAAGAAAVGAPQGWLLPLQAVAPNPCNQQWHLPGRPPRQQPRGPPP